MQNDTSPPTDWSWTEFVNEYSGLPVLIRCALAHYQFETIHPLLYLSGYLEIYRDEYYDRLQAVREKGEIQEYLQFFLNAVKAAADDAVDRSGRLVELRERYHTDARLDRSRVAALIPMLFRNPFLSAQRVSNQLGVTPQGARNLLERAAGYGWITEWSTRRRGNVVWVASEIMSVIELPLTYGQPPGAPSR